MRKLMWFAIGFVSSCVTGVYLLSGLWLLLTGFAALIGAASLYLLRSNAGKAAVLAVLGCAVGFFWLWGYDALYLSDAREMDTQVIDTAITATDYSYETDYGVAGDGKLTLDGKTYRVRYYLNADEAIQPGDVLRGQVRLRYTADGGSKSPTYHRGDGIFFLAYCDTESEITHLEEVPLRYFAANLRQKITALLDSLFPEDTLAFTRALLLGDSSLLTYEMDTDFSVSGIRHVIAVSGLHVSILFAFVYLFLGERRFLTPLVGIGILVLFAAVAGFTPSVVRACIMQGLMLLALLFNKEYDPPTALSFAVLAMLIVNPVAITSVSLQLSAGCMVGIFLFSGKIQEYFLDERRFGPAKGKSLKARLIRWVVGSVSVTLGAMAATTPLCAWYFGSVSLVGILTNLLTLWIISFIFYGIMASCAIGAFLPSAGRAVAWIVSWMIRYVTGVAGLLASFPLAAVYTSSIYVVLWLVFCYVLLAVFCLSKQKQPLVLGCCIAAGLCIALAASWLEPRMDDYRLTVLDVGQGQCVLLQNHEEFYLVDCGGDYADGASDAAAQLLLSQGITRLDGIIVTHYDDDHAGGVGNLMTRIQTEQLYLPDIEDTTGIRQELTAAWQDRIVWLKPESAQSVSAAGITVFAGEAGKSDNESSLCVLFQPENCDILITGDRNAKGERYLLEQAQLPDLEILVVGHHGAKSSTSLELLHETAPEIAVISAGANNNYGHPSQEVLERLALFGVAVYRTDQLGTVIFRG